VLSTRSASPESKRERTRLPWEEISQAVRPWIPFTALNTVWRHLDKEGQSILDVGCGKGRPMAFVNRRHRFFAVGIDIFRPYLLEARALASYDALVQGDVRCPPFRARSFDIVLLLEILEHLERAEGLALIKVVEQIARRQVLITRPVGHHQQHEYDGNPWQEHRHIWAPRELRALGYRAYGHGLRNLGGLSGVQSPLPRPLRPVADFLWVAAGPPTHLRPEWAGNMVCVKWLAREL
jgi:SAM-dependent methyltransferase